MPGVTHKEADFALQIEAWCERAKKRMDATARLVTLEMFTKIIQRSPVRSGRFRANWQVGIDAIPTGLIRVNDVTGELAISKATAAIMKLKAGQKIHLVNNLPYARRLEYGYSRQAPAGMVRITVREFQGLLKKAAGQAKTIQ
jgi:hypothetical protein